MVAGGCGRTAARRSARCLLRHPFVRRRAAAIGRTVDELEQRHEIALGQLRTQQMRAQAELEQTCNNLKRQLKASAGKSSAPIARPVSKF